ncbi:hypothetical protein PACTADRAFT_81170 [Pachysolen tannophilus NRRL Y-2460]|uniref:Uncharacterized protein n=1 Tax=Pachysolen tannophilus NRRL Y-2460 TaxID=669874 RepID=A0A1E4TSE8_PACTA|nr:hypothetical protein PACTADRAFT_81170 [Pachysolen tannophilus NRRL Y-2460]
MGSTKSSDTYSDIYLIEFSFNKSSTIFPLIEDSYEEEGTGSIANMTVRTGYLGLCVIESTNITCSSRSDLTIFDSINGVSLYDSSSNETTASLDLIHIAGEFANKASNPYLLMVSLGIIVALFCNILYSAVPYLPFKNYSNKLTLILSSITTLLWGFGAMWSEICGKSVKRLIEPGSMYIITATQGSKALAMIWTAFTMIFITCIGCFILYLKDAKIMNKKFHKDQDEDKKI